MSKNESTKIDIKGSAFKKYFYNTSWLFSEKAVRMIVNFLVGIFVVRYLGAELNGVFAYATSLVGILTAVAALGLTNIITREFVKSEDDADSILGTSFIMKSFSSVLLFLLILVFYLTSSSYENLILLIVSASLVLSVFDQVEFFFNARVEAKFPVIVKFTSFIVVDVLKIAAIIFQLDLVYFAAIFSLEKLILSAGLWMLYHQRKGSILKWTFDKSRAKQLLHDSWPLMFSTIAVTIYMRIDKVILKELMNSEAVGIYDAAVRLCEGWYFIPMAISSSLFPAIVNAKKKSEKFYNDRLQKLYDLMVFISVGIALPVTLFSEQIITLAYGENFIDAASVLTIYIWAGVPVFLGTANSQYLINENFTKISLARTVIGMILNIALNFILIPLYGLKGSAWATLISYFISVFFIILLPRSRAEGLRLLSSLFLLKPIMRLFK